MTGATVYIVDDDGIMRRTLASLLEMEGYVARTFASGEDFLRHEFPLEPSCLMLDLQMPGLPGTGVQEHLRALQWHPPVVFMTAHGTVPVTAQAMKAGAIDFLTKPLDPRTVLTAVSQALAVAGASLEQFHSVAAARQLIKSLTPREREVLQHVVSGKINKEIGNLLGTTERTIKAHRSSIMRKLQAKSVADLVRLADRAA